MPDGAPRVAKLKPPSALAWRAIHLAALRTVALWRERPAALSARIANAVVGVGRASVPLGGAPHRRVVARAARGPEREDRERRRVHAAIERAAARLSRRDPVGEVGGDLAGGGEDEHRPLEPAGVAAGMR